MNRHKQRVERLDHRFPEPELMESVAQVRAYAEADFSASDQGFVEQYALRFGEAPQGRMIDLGCGPGALTALWKASFPGLHIDAVDGSQAMIDYARSSFPSREIVWHVARLPLGNEEMFRDYDVVISNSLLHHLPSSDILWQQLIQLIRPGSKVLISDLLRPQDVAEAQHIVRTYASEAAALLQEDFFNSLRAAYRIEEVRQQLERHRLPWLSVSQVSDRHLLVWGVSP